LQGYLAANALLFLPHLKERKKTPHREKTKRRGKESTLGEKGVLIEDSIALNEKQGAEKKEFRITQEVKLNWRGVVSEVTDVLRGIPYFCSKLEKGPIISVREESKESGTLNVSIRARSQFIRGLKISSRRKGKGRRDGRGGDAMLECDTRSPSTECQT